MFVVLCAVVGFHVTTDFPQTLLQTTAADDGEASITPQAMWDAIAQDVNTMETRIHIPFSGCNNCLRPPIERTRGAGEGLVMCYFWSECIDLLSNFTAFSAPRKQCAVTVPAAEVCINDRVPESPITLFGNAHTHFRNSRFVWYNPNSEDMHRLQGYLLYPAGGGKDTIHISVSLAVDTDNDCPAPAGETQHVEWVLVHQHTLVNANAPGNFTILDYGSFDVVNNRVLEGGKVMSDEPVFVGGFKGTQAIGLWIRTEFDTADPNMEGKLILSDLTSFTFIGECKRVCQHCHKPAGCTGDKCTGCLNSHICRCECEDPWTGKDCSECPRQCVHGTLDSNCQCQCKGLWKGALCNECPLDCGEGGVLDPNTCTCKCKGNWERNPTTGKCSDCLLHCKHKPRDQPNADCVCECQDGWVGKECEICNRECLHGVLDEATCTCSCNETHWEGGKTDPLCQVCNRECAHRNAQTRMRPEDCTCINCPYPWTGRWCHICARDQCQNGRLLNATLENGSVTRDRSNNVIQSTDTSRLTCFGRQQDDCTCCCDSIFASPSEDSRYATMRFTGDHCEAMPNFCPGGTRSTGVMKRPELTCAPCQGHWEGRLCDGCFFQCFHGTTNGDPYCRCQCESGWRHQIEKGNEQGQCNICEPMVVGGPTCVENENDRNVGFSCHQGYKSRKRSGKCGPGTHLCTPSEVELAVIHGWRFNGWAQYFHPNSIISGLPVKCVTAFTSHIRSESWTGTKLYFVDPATNLVHAQLTHNGGQNVQQKVCLPATRYRVYLCGRGSGSYPTVGTAERFNHINDIDLAGDIVYAVNFNGPSLGRFSAEWATPGINYWSQYTGTWGNKDAIGSSDFQRVMNDVRWSGYGNDLWFTANVETGTYYKLVLLMLEGCCNRGYDIYVNGVRVSRRFAPYLVAGSNSRGYAKFTYFFTADSGTMTVRLYGDGSFQDNNPTLSAFTLKRLGLADMSFRIPEISDSYIYGRSISCDTAYSYDLDLGNPAVGVSCPNNDFPCPSSTVMVETPIDAGSPFNSAIDGHASLCCSNECSGTKYCDGYKCSACETCPSGKFSDGCAGASKGTCKACSASECKSGQTYVATKCGGRSNGCVDSACATTGCQ